MKNSIASTKSWAIGALLALTAAGCSNDETAANFVAEGTPIRVNTIVGELSTKAGYDDTDNKPTAFYLQITNPKNDKYSYFAQMKSNNGTWESFDPKDATGATALPMYWAGDGNNVKVTAATFDFRNPTSGKAETSTDVTIASDQSDADKLKACDHLMQLTTDTKPSTDGITVSLIHLTAKIRVVVDLGKDNTDTQSPLTKLEVSGTKLTRTCTFSDPNASTALTTPTWADVANTDATVITACPAGFTQADATAGKSATAEYEAIVVPQEIAQGELGVSFEMKDGKVYNWKSVRVEPLASNTQYTLNLRLHGDALTLSSIIVDDWGTRESHNAGVMTEIHTGTLTVAAGGQVTDASIAEALSSDGKLKIAGPINASDITTLVNDKTVKALDLTNAYAAEGYDLNSIAFNYKGNNTTIYNTTLEEIIMPKKMTSVADGCFKYCTSLKSVTLQYGVTQIVSFAFAGCSKLESVTLPESLTNISGYAFLNCTSLKSITLPNSLTSFGDHTFEGCTGLTSITIPAGVGTLSELLFNDCTNLKTVYYLGNSLTIKGAFADCSSLTGLYLTACTALPSPSSEDLTAGNVFSVSALTVHLSTTLFNTVNEQKNAGTLTGFWSDTRFTFTAE